MELLVIVLLCVLIAKSTQDNMDLLLELGEIYPILYDIGFFIIMFLVLVDGLLATIVYKAIEIFVL